MNCLRPILLLLAAASLIACSKTESTSSAAAAAPAAEPEYADSPIIEIHTSEGVIRAELYKTKSPKTVANFLQYLERKHFDNTVFHRVIKGFMIQGGGFEKKDGNLVEKETLPPVANESMNNLKNRVGTLAMARTNDPNSATAQFYINTVDNPALDLGQAPAGYTVFGKVLAGMDIVSRIEGYSTGSRMLTSRGPDGKVMPAETNKDVPLKDILIQTITLVKPGA